ncbi:hypothetical protein [Chryseobacterium flavum]|uniref:hypothetical protein n=1 Tax=Chryseobacterium flavum TaxID=415851 RepID=UPI002FDB6949
MAFEINYVIGNLETYFRQDEMNVLFFYAKDINLNLTKKMNYLLDKKTTYMIGNNISTDGFDSDDDLPAYFNVGDIQNVIQFITSQLIPAMQNESVNMDGKYGGTISSLINNINNYDSGDIAFMLYVSLDYVPVEMSYYISKANEIKDLLQTSLNLNTPILVSYTD